jgi:multicomponent K+:H+ antiporter subunit G
VIAEIVVSALLLIGAAFTLIGSISLARLPDFYTRLHGPTKATTVGVGSLLIASMIYFAAQGEGLQLRDLLVSLFLFMTAPVSAHLLSKAALSQNVPTITARPADARGHQLPGRGEPARAGASEAPPPEP